MSPDSLRPTRARRAWRAIACLGCVLGAASLLLTAWLWQGDQKQTEEAVCSIVRYAEAQGTIVASGDPTSNPPRAPNPQGAAELFELSDDMRSTGISCPPRE
jgi:hypothetical protein